MRGRGIQRVHFPHISMCLLIIYKFLYFFFLAKKFFHLTQYEQKLLLQKFVVSTYDFVSVQTYKKIKIMASKIQARTIQCVPFQSIPQVQQHKLDSCSMGCLSKTLQGLSCKHLDYSFSENLVQFSKNSMLRTKNDRDV